MTGRGPHASLIENLGTDVICLASRRTPGITLTGTTCKGIRIVFNMGILRADLITDLTTVDVEMEVEDLTRLVRGNSPIEISINKIIITIIITTQMVEFHTIPEWEAEFPMAESPILIEMEVLKIFLPSVAAVTIPATAIVEIWLVQLTRLMCIILILSLLHRNIIKLNNQMFLNVMSIILMSNTLESRI